MKAPQFFFDTNIVIGLCNPSDRINRECKILLKKLNPSSIYLLYSVQKEFRGKIQEVFDSFLNRAKDFISVRRSIELETLEGLWPQNIRNINFDKKVFKLLKARGKKIIDLPIITLTLREFYREFLSVFNNLNKSWIHRPSWHGYDSVVLSDDYQETFSKIRPHIHSFDAQHIALAVYLINQQSKRGLKREYIFYTSDIKWEKKDIFSYLSLEELKLKVIAKEDTLKRGKHIRI